MRQGVSTLSLCLILIAIVGCGGSSGYKNSAGTLTSTNLATGSSSPAPGTTATPGANSGSTGGSSAGSTTPTNPPAPPVPATPTDGSTRVVISSPVEGASIGSPAQVSAGVVGPTAIS